MISKLIAILSRDSVLTFRNWLEQVNPNITHQISGEHIGALAAMMYAIIDADMVTCSSKALMDYLTQFNPNTYLLPNYLNDRLWNL
ncbi:unnamed protein product, partial [marine sediment metagenome]